MRTLALSPGMDRCPTPLPLSRLNGGDAGKGHPVVAAELVDFVQEDKEGPGGELPDALDRLEALALGAKGLVLVDAGSDLLLDASQLLGDQSDPLAD